MSGQTPRILLVDDEQSVQELLSYPLRKDGYEVVQAGDGKEALKLFGESRFDLVILDVMMPQMDGLECCRRLRASSPVPIIMLTAQAEEADKIVGLELGADDYITKPFSVRELRSRIKALLRRSAMSLEPDDGEGVVEAGELRIDPVKRSVTVGDEPVELTFVEYEMLMAMAGSPGRVWSRDQLLGQVWGSSDYRDPRTVDVHIRHLREKIEAEPGSPEYLLTVRGVGYRFRDDEG
ncbi:MAG: response regulator [Solirubrobacterales bacterium]